MEGWIVTDMNNLILFVNSFLSYLLLMAVIVVIAGIAVFAGIKMRRRKTEQLAAKDAEAGAEHPSMKANS